MSTSSRRRLAWSALVAATSLVLALPRASAQTAPIIIESNQAGARLGWSVAHAGDLNKDGLSDLVVGAPGWTNGEEKEGAAFVYFGKPTGVSNIPAWTYESDQAGAALGTAVAGVGDFTADLVPEVAVGAPGFDGAVADEGSVLVFKGDGVSLSSGPAWQFDGGQPESGFGSVLAAYPVATAAGSAGVIVGAPLHDNGEVDEGRAYVFNAGSTSQSPWWVAESDVVGARFGSSIAAAGDVNKDAYDEVIVGAPYWSDKGYPGQGQVYVFWGSGSGPAGTPWTLSGAGPWAYFGNKVAAAGDVNADGRLDLLVGSADDMTKPNNPGGGYDNDVVGRVHVLYSAKGSQPFKVGWAKDSAASYDQFGGSVAPIKDVNGDGINDFVVGTRSHNTATADQVGKVEVYFGRSPSPTQAPSLTLSGTVAHGCLGHVVAAAGDVNGDGKADLVVGVPGYSNGEEQEGAIYVYLTP